MKLIGFNCGSYSAWKRAIGVPVKGLKRAKKRLKVRSVKTGGRRQGWAAVWVWQVPAAVS
jgi:hypothetical protein